MRLGILLLTLCLLTSCGHKERPPVIRPVRIYKVPLPEAGRIRTFSGTAKASEESILSFRVPGKIIKLPVSVGDAIEIDEILGDLDPLDYQLEVEQAEANLRRAQANCRNANAIYERVRALYETETASRTDLDNARAEAEGDRAAVVAAEKELALARRRLEYTHLRAPADGFIAQKVAEVNENVDAGQPVLQMVSGTQPEVDIQMPESLIGHIDVGSPVSVRFQALGGKVLKGRVLHVGVSTTGTSTTFPVTLRIEDPSRRVRSGMSAEVSFTLPHTRGSEIVTVPSSAVGEDSQGSYVYLLTDYDGRTGLVQRRHVVLGDLLDRDIEIREGLTGGEWIVTAGLEFLKEGERVSIYKGKPYGESR